MYKTLYSTHIYTNAHTDCVQLKPRASVCVYYDFLYQVKGSENSIFSAQRHMHTVTSAELSRLSSVALTAKHFYQLRHHFTIVSCKLHWLFQVQMLDLHLELRYGINHSVTGSGKHSLLRGGLKWPRDKLNGKGTSSFWHQSESSIFANGYHFHTWTFKGMLYPHCRKTPVFIFNLLW